MAEIEIFRLAIAAANKRLGSATISGPTPTDADQPEESRNPLFEEIVEGILFSRWFMTTYNLLLLGILVLVCVAHQFRLHLRKRQRHARNNGEDGYSAPCRQPRPSSSRPPRTAESDETKPLLPGAEKRGIWNSIWLRIRGILEYQPSQWWGYESPPISTCLLLLGYYGLNGFYGFYRVSLLPMKIFIVADRMGCVFVINLPLLYLMSAKNPSLKWLTGWSYERLNILHRAAGRVCILAACGHFAGFLWVQRTLLADEWPLGKYLAIPGIAFGLVSWSSYILLGLTSKEEFRAAFYEVFLFLHVLLQTIALIFLFFHHPTARPYVLAAVLIFLLDRILYRILYASTRMTGNVTLYPDGETVCVSLMPPPSFSWQSGDHVFLSIPQVALLNHPHPFSIITPPPPWGTRIDLLIRARDGFSHQLTRAASQHSEVSAIVDGPYGSDHAFECLDSAPVAVAVAGGSGIAVVYPLIHGIAVQDRGSDPEMQRRMGKKMVLLWIVRAEDCSRTWLPVEAMNELRMAGVEVLVHVTQTKGYRPDLKTMLGLVAKDGLGVVVCGPDSMVRDVRNACASMMRHGRSVEVVTEKFGW
ncbi:hypothetical protein EX30DRAFT_338071 [Ascodesmis nigricans]|uniref:ferric-chelate reductase (NADPH) n=1 Tax=Ascodesmis nigricans TaxID=341454 RepID=A0A4S2N8V4_9PEZI|nr:hypothetical protein EX30DRAFT_338071 [Ascodesmis nigricans]